MMKKAILLLVALLCAACCFADTLSDKLTETLESIVPKNDSLIIVSTPLELDTRSETAFSPYLKNCIELVLSGSGKEIFDLDANMESESFIAELFDSGYDVQNMLDEREAPVGEVSALFSAHNNIVDVVLEYKSYYGNTRKTMLSCSTKGLPGLIYDEKEASNSKKIAVFGNETYYLPSGDLFESTENMAVKKFCELLQKNFDYTSVSSSLKFDSYYDMRDYAETHKDEFDARYVVFSTTETESDGFGKKQWINARISFIMLDLQTGTEYESDEATSVAMSATMTTVSDEQAKTKSRTAIDNACNPDKNPESLLIIMQKVFDNL